MNDLTTDFGFSEKKNTNNSMETVSESRATAEVQAAYVIAKKFPRNEQESFASIINACKRPFLAEQAIYAYPRGGSVVKGPSIRLAEAMGQSWGNLDCGIREISQSGGVSVAEAYAIDLQTNTRITKIFHVKHERHTKKGITRLTDPRDIYELVANQGSRRLRACILGIIPGDVVEAAVEQCNRTMQSSEVPIVDQIRRLVIAFDELGVKVEHLEKRLGHNLDATIPTEVVTLRTIYKSIKDGMAKREDFFEINSSQVHLEAKEKISELLKNKKGEPKVEEKKSESCEEAKEFFEGTEGLV